MDIIDTEKLALFHHQLTQLASDNEENWYLVKRIIQEMEMDDLSSHAAVLQELTEALIKLERMMEVFQGIKQMTALLASDYEDLAYRHETKFAQMAEYASSLKAIHHVLADENTGQIIPITSSYTAPIHLSIQKQYGVIEVEKDES